MEKYTGEELKEIKEIMKECTDETLIELLRYINDSEFTESFLKFLEEEESEENLYTELISRIFDRVPDNDKREFLGEINREYMGYLYSIELTKEYPECFKYAVEYIVKDYYYKDKDEALERVFELTDIRKCC